MIVALHTPEGIDYHELTLGELVQFAAEGDVRARCEIAGVDIPGHTSPHYKINLLAWVLAIIDIQPIP